MKKLLFVLSLLIFGTALSVNAEVMPHTIYAVSTEELTAENIKTGEVLNFKALDEYSISETEKVEKNAEITVKVIKYSEPKRGKRNGFLNVSLISYEVPSLNEKRRPNEKLKGTLKLSTPKDIKSIAKNAGVSVAGHILKVPGFSQALAVSKGLLEPNENQSRLKSAGQNLYESTPLVYIEKGKDLNIEKDSIVVIKLKTKDE